MVCFLVPWCREYSKFYLIKADNVDGPTDVDAARADTVDLALLQSTLGEHDADSKGRWESGGHCNGHQVHGPQEDFFKSLMLLDLKCTIC